MTQAIPTEQKEFQLKGLDCPVCTEKLRKVIEKLDGVTSASLDFATQRLVIEVSRKTDNISGLIEKTVTENEPEVTVTPIQKGLNAKTVLFVRGFDCASCAAVAERAVQKIDGVTEAVIDFAQERLTFTASDIDRVPALIRKIAAVIEAIEPGVTVTVQNEARQTVISGGLSQKEREHDHSHDHDHNHSHMHEHAQGGRLTLAVFIAGAFLFAAGFFLPETGYWRAAVYSAALLATGWQVYRQAFRNILKGRVFDENFLMSIASIGAFVIAEFPEGVAVMIFYQVGEYFQSKAVEKSRRSIAELMDIRPDYANLKTSDGIGKVSVYEVGKEDIIIVRPGEKVPLDGIVIKGASALDMSSLTGESAPVDVKESDSILSGSVNINGVLEVKVTKAFGESTVSKILELVENATSRKSPVENFITKFAGIYTPAVVGAAVLLAVFGPLLFGGARYDWLYRALTFLVISCPCALVISVPLSFFAGIGSASSRGILVKGSNYLEALNDIDTFVFDKTGTLTKGIFKVVGLYPAEGVTQEALLEAAAYGEAASTHPIAVSILQAYGQDIDNSRISDIKEVAGKGISAHFDGHELLVGNRRFLEENIVEIAVTADLASTIIYIAQNGVCLGAIAIDDEIREDSRQALSDLRKTGMKNLIMLTGDKEETASAVAGSLGIDTYFAELLPQDKVSIMEDILKNAKGKVAFAGDGINDAPVLALSDVGFAMGAIGSDAAIEAADVVLMRDEPSRIPTAIAIAKKTKTIVWQNIIFALGVKAVVLVLGALGIANMWIAVFADVGVACLAVLNALRALKMP